MTKFERVINAMGITFYQLEKIIPLKIMLITVLIFCILIGVLISFHDDKFLTNEKMGESLLAIILISLAIVGMAYNASYIAAKKNRNGKTIFWVGLALPIITTFYASMLYEDKSKQAPKNNDN